MIKERPQITLAKALGLGGAHEGGLDALCAHERPSATASAILARMRLVPRAAAFISQRSAPGPSARKAASAALWARGVRASAPSGRGG